MKCKLRQAVADVLLCLLVIPTPTAGQNPIAAQSAKKGLKALQDGNLQEAKASLMEAVRLNPKQPAYRATLGEIDLRLGDTQNAIQHFEIALKLNPSDTDVRSKLVQVYWPLHRDLDIIRTLQVADPPEPLRSLWRFSRGLSLFRLGRLSAARREFRSLVTNPDFAVTASFFLGRIEYAQNHFEAALPFFAKAVQLTNSSSNPELNAYLYNYGLTLFRLGRYDEAHTQFTRTTELYAKEPSSWMMRGRCEEELGKHSDAITSYEESLRIDPNFELTYYHLARLQQRYGDKQRAAELFKRLGDLREEDIREREERALKLKTDAFSNSSENPNPH